MYSMTERKHSLTPMTRLWRHLPFIVFWVALFLACTRIYSVVFSFAKEITEGSDAVLGRLPCLLLRDSHPCATLSVVLLVFLYLSHCISKGKTTRVIFSFFIVPLVSLSVTLAISLVLLYSATTHTIPVLRDIPLPGLVDVTGLLLVIVSVAHMAKRAGDA